MNSERIGYNVGKINDLLKDIADSYNDLGEKMSNGWSSVSNTLEKEWVGPDEVSYEKELAKNICTLYGNCKEIIQKLVGNIVDTGNSWKEFQSKNVLENAEISTVSAEITIPTLKDYDISSIVKAGNPTFDASTNMGLKSTSSYTVIQTELDDYVNDVYSSVKGMYDKLDSSNAFLGKEQSTKIDSYLHEIGESIAKLTTCHKSIKEALDKLANSRYTSQETAFANSYGEADTSMNYNGENLK